jgi:hypothetical protein
MTTVQSDAILSKKIRVADEGDSLLAVIVAGIQLRQRYLNCGDGRTELKIPNCEYAWPGACSTEEFNVDSQRVRLIEVNERGAEMLPGDRLEERRDIATVRNCVVP